MTGMTGIILAGGRSRRMGTDKTQLPWEGGTLLTAVADALAPLCREILIVGPRRSLPREVRWVEDRYMGCGPLAGLHAGFEAAAFDGTLVIACDMPMVPRTVFQELLRLSGGADMVIPVHAGGYEPLCAWYRRDACLPVVRKLLAEKHFRLQDIMSMVRVAELKLDEHFPGVSAETLFVNINTFADYERQIVQMAKALAGKVG